MSLEKIRSNCKLRTILDQFYNQSTTSESEVDYVFREPSILTGYRLSNQTWFYYIHSLFEIHNETFNVWSHLIGCFVILYSLCRFSNEFNVYADKDIWPLLTFGYCSMLTCFISALVHLFHSKSVFINYLSVMIDYSGISIYGFGTGIIAMYSCSSDKVYALIEPIFLALIVFSSFSLFLLLCIGKIMFGSNLEKKKRNYIISIGVFIEAFAIFLPFLPRYIFCLIDHSKSLTDLNHTTITLPFFILQGFFYVSHIPERFWPGKCDIFIQGHHVFHILTVITVLLQQRAVYIDIKIGNTSHAHPDMINIVVAFICLVVIEFVSFFILKRYIPSKNLQKTE